MYLFLYIIYLGVFLHGGEAGQGAGLALAQVGTLALERLGLRRA
jgi:hypothetical protein